MEMSADKSQQLGGSMRRKLEKTSRRFIWAITILLVVLFLFASLLSGGEPMKLDSTEKIASLYHENEALLNQAVKGISAYRQIERVEVTIDEKDALATAERGIFEVQEINGVYFITSEPLEESDYQKLYDAFYPLITKLQENGLFRDAVMYGSSEKQVGFGLEYNGYGKYAELYYYMSISTSEVLDRCADYIDKMDLLQINSRWMAKIETH